MNHIKFVNGSEIKTIEGYQPSDVPMMIFGVDMAKPDSKDMSAISYYCSKCKTVFKVVTFDNDTYYPELYDECPECKAKFKGWIQNY